MSDNMERILAELKAVIPEERILRNEPMSKHTTFQIGGPADFLILPRFSQEIAEVLAVANKYELPLTVIGNGSNILVRDKGIRGLVIKIGDQAAYIRREGNRIIAGAGALLADVSRYAAQHTLSGLEFAVGIPGSIGGAVYMNAGAYDGEISHVIGAVTAVSPDGAIQRFSGCEGEFGYRRSIFQDNQAIICEVELELQLGDQEKINEKMADFTSKRKNKQPIDMPSAGSTFKRPPGYFAGTLIEQAGLKGKQVGGAQVSTKHAGFVVNAGGASAADVMTLIQEVQQCVQEKFNVDLYPEIRILGEV